VTTAAELQRATIPQREVEEARDHEWKLRLLSLRAVGRGGGGGGGRREAGERREPPGRVTIEDVVHAVAVGGDGIDDILDEQRLNRAVFDGNVDAPEARAFLAALRRRLKGGR
jgi:hypothetical protein